MKTFLAYESGTSYSWEDDEAPFTLTLPYVRLNTGSSSSSSGDENDEEISSDLETSSDLDLIEPSGAAAVPLAKVGHQKLAAKASCSLFKFMKPVKDCTDAEIKQIKKIKRCQRRQICRGDRVKHEIGRVHITSLRNVTTLKWTWAYDVVA